MPIRNYQYRQFTIANGIVSRVVGQTKISVQRIYNGKLRETVQFNGKVIRNLTILTGVDAISGKHFHDKLDDIPAKPARPKEQVLKWLGNHWPQPPPKETAESQRLRHHDWSKGAILSHSPTNCCSQTGLCQACRDDLCDVQEELDDQLADVPTEVNHLNVIENYWDPLGTDSSSSCGTRYSEEDVKHGEDDVKYGEDDIKYSEDDISSGGHCSMMNPLCSSSSCLSAYERSPACVRKVRGRGNWLQQFRVKQDTSGSKDNFPPSDHHTFLDRHFPGGAVAAHSLVESWKRNQEDKVSEIPKPPHKPWIEQEEERKAERKKRKAKRKQKRK